MSQVRRSDNFGGANVSNLQETNFVRLIDPIYPASRGQRNLECNHLEDFDKHFEDGEKRFLVNIEDDPAVNFFRVCETLDEDMPCLIWDDLSLRQCAEAAEALFGNRWLIIPG